MKGHKDKKNRISIQYFYLPVKISFPPLSTTQQNARSPHHRMQIRKETLLIGFSMIKLSIKTKKKNFSRFFFLLLPRRLLPVLQEWDFPALFFCLKKTPIHPLFLLSFSFLILQNPRTDFLSFISLPIRSIFFPGFRKKRKKKFFFLKKSPRDFFGKNSGVKNFVKKKKNYNGLPFN